MGLNATPEGERFHIAFFGKRNAGKSSLVNAITNQIVSIVSDTKGTTTDPVRKSMELLPLGPVLIIDTPGYDDVGTLGELRVRRTKEVLEETDCAVLVVDGLSGFQNEDAEIVQLFIEKKIPYCIVFTKADLAERNTETDENFKSAEIANEKITDAKELSQAGRILYVSAKTGQGISELKEILGRMRPENGPEQPLVSDLVSAGDFVLLVIPIDKAAPKGRLILPQQQVIRDLLDHQAIPIESSVENIPSVLQALSKAPRMVITDSQAFREVSELVPEEIPLTSFSILFARYKGILKQAVEGAAELEHLQPEDRILIAEGCTHHRQCGDIGTQKLPKLLEKYTGHTPIFETSSGKTFPRDEAQRYRLIIHCGGCMLGEREVQSRMRAAEHKSVPMTNFGIAIAQMNGILRRSLSVFPELQSLLEYGHHFGSE